MALSLVEIKAILLGFKEGAVEADALSTSIAGTGKAAKAANAEAAASAKTAASAQKKADAERVASLKKVTRSMRTVGTGLTKYVTAPLIAAGAAAVVMDLHFERSVIKLHTQAGVARGELQGLEKDFLGVARATTFSPTEISDAAFRLAGAGMRGKQLENATLASAQLAMVGEANPEDTAKTIAQIWYQNIKGAGDFNHIIGEINATVGEGDLRLPQLVDALGTGVVASAKAAGLSLQDVNAAMAVFGDSTNNVSGWAAQFATALHYFTAPGEKAGSAMEALGLHQMQLSEDFAKPNGLIVALKDLKKHLDALPGGMMGTQGKRILGEILPGGRGRVFLNLLNSIPKLEEKIVGISKTTGDFHKVLRETEENPLVRLENAWSNIQATLIEVGAVLVPIVVPAIEALAEGLQSAVKWFKGLDPTVQKIVGGFVLFLAVLGPVLLIVSAMIPAIEALAVVVGLILSPVGLVIVALVALAAGFLYAYTHVKWFHNAVDDVFNWVKSHWRMIVIPFLPIVLPFVLLVTHLQAAKEALGWVVQAGEDMLHWFETSTLGKILTAPYRALYWYIKNVLLPAVESIVEVAETAAEIITNEQVGPGAKPGKHYAEELEPGRVAREKGPNYAPPTGTGLPPSAYAPSGKGKGGGPNARVVRRARGELQRSHTGTATGRSPRKRDIHLHSTLVMPDGRVLAEVDQKTHDDDEARL